MSLDLTDSQKRAGRAFRDEQQAALDALNVTAPPDKYVLSSWRVVRHDCPAAGGASIGITLREHRHESPEYWVDYCGAVGVHSEDFPHWDCQGGLVTAAAGSFSFTWKDGKCSGCGETRRSRTGLSGVDTDRLADSGRTASGGQAGPHHRDSGLARA